MQVYGREREAGLVEMIKWSLVKTRNKGSKKKELQSEAGEVTKPNKQTQTRHHEKVRGRKKQRQEVNVT